MSDLLDRLKSALADRYAIQDELGTGGMATVYLAEDLRHHRKVAVKVLRPDLAAALGPERFLREIEIAAQLQHPHILTLIDSGEADGFLYYVMPYVEGESLRAKLAREGELPVPEAAQLLREVVDALSHAHSMGVVHRDIKPDNVLLSGHHAVVTDFGVAKAVSEATGRQELTTAGVALGTPAYMSPEQAVADPHIDHRTDIYAVGALAYELLTGRPPFTGTTPQMILSAHVTDTPDPVTKHRPAASPAMNQLVMKCLEKKAADRFQTAGELLPHLHALSTPSGGITPTDTRPVAAALARRSKTTIVAAAVILLVIVSAAVLLLRRGEPGAMTVGRTTQLTRAPGLELDPALSPDGNALAYAAGSAGQMRIFVRQISGGGELALTQDFPGHHRAPLWSPDGSRIMFQSAGVAYSVPVFGGTPRRVVDPPAGALVTSPVLSPDGQQVAYVRHAGTAQGLLTQRQATTIYTQAITRGEPQAIADAVEAHSLRWSPDGKWIAYVSGASLFVFGRGELGNIDPSSIWIVSTAGGEPIQVVDDEYLNVSPAWMPDGEHVLFVSNRDGSRDVYQFALSGSGRPSGQPLRITTGLNAHTIGVSNDGAQLTYSVFTHHANVWSLGIPDRSATSITEARPVTNEAQMIEVADVSKDGEWLAFDSDRVGNQDIYRMPMGGGQPEQLTTHPTDDYAPDWSPDGTEILFYSLRNGNRDVYLMSADGRNLQQLTDDPAEDRYPRWSPDGNQLVFASNRAGRYELYRMTRSQAGAEWTAPEQLTSDGGFMPRWSPGGREIVYRSDPSRGIRVLSPERGASRMLVQDDAGALTSMLAEWSPDGRTVYYLAMDERDTPSVWSVPSGGGVPTPLVRFDDPAGRSLSGPFDTDGKRFFFVLSERESNIWVAELQMAR